jgi:formate-dependent phosphoribosylglycinamide formyltransferase (GAR transformylase)
LGSLARFLKLNFTLFNLTIRDITHKQIRQAHTKTSQPSPLSFTYKTENEYIQEQPTTNMGGSILSLSILLKLSQVYFVFPKNPKSDPLSSHS